MGGGRSARTLGFDMTEPPTTVSYRARVTDLLIAGALGVVLVVPYLLLYAETASSVYAWATATGAVMVGSMALRRAHPWVMVALLFVGAVAQALTVPFPVASIVVVPFAIYSVARWVVGPSARLVLVPGAFGSILGPSQWLGFLASGYVASSGVPWVLYALAVTACVGLVVTTYIVGRRVRESAVIRTQSARVAAERYQALLSEREQDARIAEARARAQIARELHDIVAHSLSVMIVQAEGGKALATKKPEAAAEVLGTIAETGREALGEMRRIVGVLRNDPQASGSPEFAPTPGLEDIPEMVARAGDRVRLRIEGDVPRVPATLGLTAYRIVQEALTNFLKHAGSAATATVTISYGPSVVEVEVADDGLGAGVFADGGGFGLTGMSERVASMGGQLIARPQPTGGFLVRAILPGVEAPQFSPNPYRSGSQR